MSIDVTRRRCVNSLTYRTWLSRLRISDTAIVMAITEPSLLIKNFKAYSQSLVLQNILQNPNVLVNLRQITDCNCKYVLLYQWKLRPNSLIQYPLVMQTTCIDWILTIQNVLESMVLHGSWKSSHWARECGRSEWTREIYNLLLGGNSNIKNNSNNDRRVTVF